MPEPSPIVGVTTSVTAFVGQTASGRFNDPVRCRAFIEYEQTFGGLDEASEVSYAVRLFFENGGSDAVVVRAKGESSEAFGAGIRALDAVDVINIICLPGLSDAGILRAAMDYSRSRRAFLIVDAPRTATTPAEMVSLMDGSDLPRSDCAAVYYPWVHVADPIRGNSVRLTAPSGAIAGIFARTDATRGVWKSPAGAHARLIDVQGAAHAVTDNENQMLNPRAVNCLRMFSGSGPVIWGARTLQGDDRTASDWKYIPVRRMAFYIEESLSRGLQWTVFEPNGEALWQQIRRSAGEFMRTLFTQRAFQGATPHEGYFLKCDSSTTTADDVTNGVVNVVIGFAPLKPAEFVVISLRLLSVGTED